MVKFGNRGGNFRGGAGRAGGNRDTVTVVGGGFKRREGGADRRVGGAGIDGGRRRGGDFGGPRRGGRGGAFRRGGSRRGGDRGGKGGNRDHTDLDEDMLQYWDKAGVKDKRKEFY